MEISLTRIAEHAGVESQYYDVGRDFSNFRRTMDGTMDQIKQKFEAAIGAKLNGKRIRARASRGYKQYVKQYEFDVVKITLDDYYDNYVIVAHDSSTPKPKEYFLKPGFKIQIIGQASGQPSYGSESGQKQNKKQSHFAVAPQNNVDRAQSQPMTPAPITPSTTQPTGQSTAQQVKESGTGHYDAYPIDTIADDIKKWIVYILKKPETTLRDFIDGLGWLKNTGNGQQIALFDITIPFDSVRVKVTKNLIDGLLSKVNQSPGTVQSAFNLSNFEIDQPEKEWRLRIKKTMTDKNV